MDKEKVQDEYSHIKTTAKLRVRWMRMKYIWVFVSICLIVSSIAVIAVKGFNFGIDFKGGSIIQIKTEKPPKIDDLRIMLEKTELQGIQVQKFGEQEAIIRLQHQNLEQKKILDIIKTKLNDYPEKVIFQRVDFVSPKVSGELIQTGGYAITLATLAMLIYIWFRFEIQFGIGAVVAMLHDVLITLGIFSLFQLEFDIATIAALLTIVGYSMNDTVVIYDRIRENLKKYRKISLPTIIDASLNETMIRTLVTSGTSVLSLIALLIFGGEVIYNFVIAMTLGVVIGSYSSIFVASPILIWLGVGREKTKENNNNIGKKIEA